VFKVRQIDPTIGFPFLLSDCVRQRQSYEKRSNRSRRVISGPYFAAIRASPIGALSSADPTANANHDERVMGETILLVHAGLFSVCSPPSRGFGSKRWPVSQRKRFLSDHRQETSCRPGCISGRIAIFRILLCGRDPNRRMSANRLQCAYLPPPLGREQFAPSLRLHAKKEEPRVSSRRRTFSICMVRCSKRRSSAARSRSLFQTV
jgi:hypothetical protein